MPTKKILRIMNRAARAILDAQRGSLNMKLNALPKIFHCQYQVVG